jgi:hypothetical protein
MKKMIKAHGLPCFAGSLMMATGLNLADAKNPKIVF